MTPGEFSRYSGAVLIGGAALFYFIRELWSMMRPSAPRGGLVDSILPFGAADAMEQEVAVFNTAAQAKIDAWIAEREKLVKSSQTVQETANMFQNMGHGFAAAGNAAAEFGKAIEAMGYNVKYPTIDEGDWSASDMAGGIVSAGGGGAFSSIGSMVAGGGGGGVVSNGGVTVPVQLLPGTGQAFAPFPMIASGQFWPGVMSFDATSHADIMGSGFQANPNPSAIQRLERQAPDPDHLEPSRDGVRAIDLED